MKQTKPTTAAATTTKKHPQFFLEYMYQDMIIMILFLFASVLVKNIYSLEFSRYRYLNQQCKILFAQAINIFDGQVKYVVFLQLVHPPHGK